MSEAMSLTLGFFKIGFLLKERRVTEEPQCTICCGAWDWASHLSLEAALEDNSPPFYAYSIKHRIKQIQSTGLFPQGFLYVLSLFL